MQLLTVVVAAFAAAAAASPRRAPPPSPDACCCCNIGKQAISCVTAIKKADCFCPAVVCPAGAPTIYEDLPAATPAP